MNRTLVILIPLLLLFMINGDAKSFPVEWESISAVDFRLEELNLSEEQNGSGIVQLNVVIQNNGTETATAGSYDAIWELVDYHLPLEGGVGILNESVVELDLNGDGDEIDSFEVTRFINATRQWDAIVDGVHAYAISEGPPEDPDSIMTYYIDEKLKIFQLGSKKHCLYRADEERADFGLSAHLEHHPCPNFHIWLQFTNSSYVDYLNVENFTINGDPVEANYTQMKWRLIIPPPLWYTDDYVYHIIIAKKGLEISAGEKVTFSCTLNATESIFIDGVCVFVHWSPDGKKRLGRWWWDQCIGGYTIIVNQMLSTTSTTTTSSTTTSSITTSSTLSSTNETTPGFSFITTLVLIFPVVFLRSRKRYT